ncbi:MAG TPA: hypothetical protein VK778_01765 [Solirubrobacteraceae bacterium]|nr:hypothetical protein [Solirubrobacteraceae bacterium]
MSLRCLSFQHYEHLFDEESIATGPEPFPGHRVMLFDPRVERGSRSIGERWRQLDAAKRTADLIIVRGSTKHFAVSVEEDTLLRDTVAEVPLITLTGSWNAAKRAPQLGAPSWASANDIVLDLDQLRTFELLTLILESKAVYRELGCHFRLPSSRFHAAAFIRLADALDDHTDLVRVADWVLPRLDDGTALLGDNGSLIGLLSVVSREALVRFDWEVPVATLNEYPSDSEMIRSFIDGFRAQDWERLLFLITVSSSGSIASRVSALDDVDIDVVVLCGTDPPGEGPATCFTRHCVERWDAGSDQSCPQCTSLHCLVVDPQTYEVRTLLYGNQRSVDIDEAGRCAPFWEAADRQDAVSLHAQVPTADGNPAGSRHHAVALDVPRLLEDPWFRDQCLEVLRRQPCPDLVLIPRHSAGAPLAELVCEAHHLEQSAVLHVSIGDFEPKLIERLRTCERVLVADDVVITAETMVALRRRVYDATSGSGDIEVWGFTAVMRPPSKLELNHVRRPFRGPAADGGSEVRLATGFEVFLPAPGSQACPWCAERDLLNNRLAGLAGRARQVAQARLTRLRASGGLEPPLLLVGDAGTTRTDGSYFGALYPKAAFAAATAVAQRQKDTFLRDRQVNELCVFNVPLALDAFFDTIVLAGLLRTFDRRDLRDVTHDAEVDRALGEYQMRPGTLIEAGLAAVNGKVPPESVRHRLENSDLGEVAELLLALLGSE